MPNECNEKGRGRRSAGKGGKPEKEAGKGGRNRFLDASRVPRRRMPGPRGHVGACSAAVPAAASRGARRRYVGSELTNAPPARAFPKATKRFLAPFSPRLPTSFPPSTLDSLRGGSARLR